MSHKSILTSENLRKKGWEGPSRCPLCMAEEETTNHLLIKCPFAVEVWHLCLKIDVEPPPSHSIRIDLLSSWVSFFPFQQKKKELLRFC